MRSLPTADGMRVHFDVRGPGVMVEPITEIDGRPLQLDATSDEWRHELDAR